MTLQSGHRPVLMGRKGAVASNHPVATQAGIDVLRADGNAADAAAAMSLALGVVEPHMSGLGGDGLYHHYDARQCEGVVYNGTGPAPLAASRAAFVPGGMPLHGPVSVSTPGSLAAVYDLHCGHGRLPWSEICQPAIAAAVDGFAATHAYGRFARTHAAKMNTHGAAAQIFLDKGQAPALTHWITQPALAETLRAVARHGADVFYRGDIAQALVQDFQRAGVAIGEADLNAFRAERQSPIAIDYRGYTISQTPPNSMGFSLLEMLKIVEQFDLSKRPFLSAESIHLMVEAKKLAFRDRERFASDPNVCHVPVNDLLSERHAAQLAGAVNATQAADINLKTAALGGSDTTYFCVLDGQGNAVSAVQSLNNAFGSGVLAPSVGVLLNNRMAYWHLAEGHPNRLEAGKRVRHTMNAPMALRDGKVVAVFGTPGGDDQVQVNLQIATGLLDYGQDAQAIVEAARWSSDQAGQEANWPHGGKNVLTVESSVGESVITALREHGHVLNVVPPFEGPCSVACIHVLGETMTVGSDPRRDGWGAAF